MRWTIILGTAVALMAGAGSAPVWSAPPDLLQAARACTAESQRLARLACFDELFGTPITPAAPTEAPVSTLPVDWRLAYDMESDRQPGEGALYRHAGQQGGHLVTLAALGATPPRPLLTVQCHNNITELALMLPKPLASERVRLSFDSAGGIQEQVWRVRDEGLVVSAGRGLPAIRTLKGILSGERLRFSASDSPLDGLIFDLAGLPAALAPLRKICGW